MSYTPAAPIWADEVEPGIYAVRFSDDAALALGINPDCDLRLFAGPGGKPAVDAYIGVMLARLVKVAR